LLPLPTDGLIPVQSTTATLVLLDVIQAGDIVSDVLSPAKGIFKGGLKKLFKNIVNFAKEIKNRKKLMKERRGQKAQKRRKAKINEEMKTLIINEKDQRMIKIIRYETRKKRRFA